MASTQRQGAGAGDRRGYCRRRRLGQPRGMPRAARITPGGMVFHVWNRGVGRRALFSAPLRGPRPALPRRAVGPPNGGTTGTGIIAASTPPAEQGAAEPMIPQRSASVPLSSRRQAARILPRGTSRLCRCSATSTILPLPAGPGLSEPVWASQGLPWKNTSTCRLRTWSGTPRRRRPYSC